MPPGASRLVWGSKLGPYLQASLFESEQTRMPASPTGTLDRAELDVMQRLFLARMPDFGDFTEPEGTYWLHERAYKEELMALCRASLPRELFDGAISANANDVLRATRTVLTSRLRDSGAPQNLVGWRYYELLNDKFLGDQGLFAESFGDLLYGADTSPIRVERFTRAMWPAYQRAASGGNPYAQARMFPTFFLMLLHPTTDIALRTDMFNSASRTLLDRRVLRASPLSAAEYEDALALAHGVRAQLEAWAWCPRDLIDVHSFLWIVTRDAKVAADERDKVDDGGVQ